MWVADYVISDYGTGAVMAVHCGDARVFDFARKYDLPIVPIILSEDDPLYEDLKDEQGTRVTSVDWDEALTCEGKLVQSGKYTGMTGGKHSEGEAAIVADLEAAGTCGDARVFDFARKYDLPIVPIILSEDDPLYEDLKDEQGTRVTSVDWDEALTCEGKLVQSGKYTGMTGGKHSEGEAAIVADLEAAGTALL